MSRIGGRSSLADCHARRRQLGDLNNIVRKGEGPFQDERLERFGVNNPQVHELYERAAVVSQGRLFPTNRESRRER